MTNTSPISIDWKKNKDEKFSTSINIEDNVKEVSPDGKVTNTYPTSMNWKENKNKEFSTSMSVEVNE